MPTQIKQYLFGVLADSVEIFGIIVVILIFLVCCIVIFGIRIGIKKFKTIDQYHDTAVALQLEMEGRKSFTDTIQRHDFELRDIYRRHGVLFDQVQHIENRCERRLELAAYDGKERRKS